MATNVWALKINRNRDISSSAPQLSRFNGVDMIFHFFFNLTTFIYEHATPWQSVILPPYGVTQYTLLVKPVWSVQIMMPLCSLICRWIDLFHVWYACKRLTGLLLFTSTAIKEADTTQISILRHWIRRTSIFQGIYWVCLLTNILSK